MYSESIIDQLEIEFGTAILSDLTGERLTRNGQPVRLFDQTKHTSETFFQADERGKPYIQNFQESKRWYPFTAYREVYSVDMATALADLQHQYATGTAANAPRRRDTQRPVPPASPITVIPAEVYKPSRNQFERNGLFAYLSILFDELTAHRIIDRYRIGTSRRWLYANMLATALPQFDVEGNLRQVKVIAFHPETGRRAKKDDYAERWNARIGHYELDQQEKVWFAGKQLATVENPNLRQCYFGEHLLTNTTMDVALVEGESTAVTMSEIWPEYHWLATGGSTGGSWDDPEKFSVFRGRKVVLFPDSGKFDDWRQRAGKLQNIAAELTVSRYVEDNAPKTNLDLRDLLTWPRWIRNDKVIYGEILPVATSESYPASIDEPNAPRAISRIKQQTIEQYPASNSPVCFGALTYDVGRMDRLFWQDWPAPPRVWPRIRTHKFLQWAILPVNQPE